MREFEKIILKYLHKRFRKTSLVNGPNIFKYLTKWTVSYKYFNKKYFFIKNFDFLN
jgi:hypothetical protein